MEFFKNYYNTKFHNDKIQLELSKTNFNNFKYNITIRRNKNNIIYKRNRNINAFSVDYKSKVASQNIITNRMIKTLNEIKPNKTNKDKIKKEYLRNFHTEIIKLKFRKNKKFRSLFDINISSPSETLFTSPHSNKKLQKRIMNLKSKTNKNIFSNILINNINTNTVNNSEIEIGLKDKNQRNEKSNSYMSDINNDRPMNKNKFLNNQLLSNDISKTHFTTMYFSPGNKSTEKSISSIHNNNKKIDNNKYNNNYYNQLTINNINPYDNNSNNTQLKYNTYNSESNNKNNIPNNLNMPNINQNYLNSSQNKIQSFITSINYISSPPVVVEFREQNLHNFYMKTRDLRYVKYVLFLQRNKLKKAKETIEHMHTLQNIDAMKFIRFYKLLKPYNFYLEKYLIFLKDTINKEHKENEKLKLIKNELLISVTEDRKQLLQIHKKFNLYLNDKFFLLCVKNSTLNIELFEENDKNEFEEDLQILELLKNYLNELSELDLKEIGIEKKKPNPKTKRPTKMYLNHAFRHQKNNKKEKYNFINIIKESHIHFKPRPIFENAAEFYDYMKSSRNKIENLLMEDNRIGIEVANLRDYVILNQEDINKAKYNKLSFDIQCNKTKNILHELKIYNTKLNIYKKNLLNNKRMKIYKNLSKKIFEIMNTIIIEEQNDFNKIIDKRKIDRPISALKELEKLIIFLTNYKNEQIENNNKEYLDTVKKIEKNKRLLVVKQRKKDEENKIIKKVQDLIQKDMKILNINNRRINYKYKPFHFKKMKKEENLLKDKDILDISY